MATANQIPLWSCDNNRGLLCQCGYITLIVFQHQLGQCLNCLGDLSKVTRQDMPSQMSLNAQLSLSTLIAHLSNERRVQKFSHWNFGFFQQQLGTIHLPFGTIPCPLSIVCVKISPSLNCIFLNLEM